MLTWVVRVIKHQREKSPVISKEVSNLLEKNESLNNEICGLLEFIRAQHVVISELQKVQRPEAPALKRDWVSELAL